MAAADLTAARLREILHYDPLTGIFTWRNDKSRARKGGIAGCEGKNLGYIDITIDQARCRAHRLAFLYMTGAWPVGVSDHINGIRTDNRWANLRDVSRQMNVQNQRTAGRLNKFGLLGVQHSRYGGRFQAKIVTQGRGKYLGTFDTPEEAHAAYVAAKRELHSGNTL